MTAPVPSEATALAIGSPVDLQVLRVNCRWCGVEVPVEVPEGIDAAAALRLVEAQAEARHVDCPKRPSPLGADPPEVDPATQRDPGAPEEPDGP